MMRDLMVLWLFWEMFVRSRIQILYEDTEVFFFVLAEKNFGLDGLLKIEVFEHCIVDATSQYCIPLLLRPLVSFFPLTS